jgi:hypothetical protein
LALLRASSFGVVHVTIEDLQKPGYLSCRSFIGKTDPAIIESVFSGSVSTPSIHERISAVQTFFFSLD